jgi:ArsR family transcriptional regulator, arsenate/arsenite/antimonite-responsive transcriptional repressor
MDEKTAVSALAALAQGMRLRIFRALVGAGPQSTLSFHLKELMHAGLVSQQRDGRHLIYRPEVAHMNDLLSYLVAHCCGGQPCEALPLPNCTDC